MNYAELLQYQGYLYLNSLFEPEDNALIVDIDRCKTPETPIGENDAFSSYNSFDVDETLPILRLEFDFLHCLFGSKREFHCFGQVRGL